MGRAAGSQRERQMKKNEKKRKSMNGGQKTSTALPKKIYHMSNTDRRR